MRLRQPGKQTKSRFVRIAFFAIIFLVLGLVIFNLSQKVNRIARRVFVSGTAGTPPGGESVSDHLKNKTPFNILLLGYGGANHEGADLTDSIIVANLNPKSKTATLISLPRDIWTKIPTDGRDGSYWKLNAAYELGLDDQSYPNKEVRFRGPAGGGNLAKYVVEKITGLNIVNFVAVDFNGFRKTIDALGGVDINVEKTFDDYAYPIEGRENDLCGKDPSFLKELSEATASSLVPSQEPFPCRYKDVHFKAGRVHLDGQTALEYVRSRHSDEDGGDFVRASRQRNLLNAVAQKVFSVNFFTKAIPFLDSLKDDFQTDISPEDLRPILAQINSFKDYQTNSLALTDKNYLDDSFTTDGQFVLVPQLGPDDWRAVQNWISASINPEAPLAYPIIRIENHSGTPGLTQIAATRLKDKNLPSSIITIPDPQKLDRTKITLGRKKIDPAVINKIKEEFSVGDENITANDPTYDILIALGRNYQPKK